VVDPSGELVRAGAEVLTEPAKEFLTKAVGSPGEEIGGTLADRIRFRRFRSQVRMVEKAQEMFQKRGLDPATVPTKVIAPLLDGVSLEDEESMIDRWAALLAKCSRGPVLGAPGFPGDPEGARSNRGGDPRRPLSHGDP
jgi:hypothetical protein